MVVCLAFINAFLTLLFGQHIGNVCIIKPSGIQGKCILLENCSSAKDSRKTGERLQNCGFGVLQPIVCCPDSPKVEPTAPIREDANHTNIITSRLNVGDISLQKCKEYSKRLNSNYCPLIREADADYRIALPQEFSHMAFIGFDSPWSTDKNWNCAGNLISDYYILTTKDCLFSHTYGYAKYVRLGGIADNDATTIKHVQIRNISELIKFPKFVNRRKEANLALVKLSSPANINEYVSPICLRKEEPTGDSFHSNDWLYYINDGSTFENPTHKVTLKRIDQANCRRTYDSVKDHHICAALISTKSKDQCSPKGALQTSHPEVTCMGVLIAVMISNRGCEDASLPVLYAKVNDYLEWIEKNVWGRKYNP